MFIYLLYFCFSDQPYIKILPCFATLCYAMLCYAMLCYAMLCYAMLCYAMLCYAMLCYATLRYAVLRCAMLCYAQKKTLNKRDNIKLGWISIMCSKWWIHSHAEFQTICGRGKGGGGGGGGRFVSLIYLYNLEVRTNYTLPLLDKLFFVWNEFTTCTFFCHFFFPVPERGLNCENSDEIMWRGKIQVLRNVREVLHNASMVGRKRIFVTNCSANIVW